jgi:hypothetical protein
MTLACKLVKGEDWLLGTNSEHRQEIDSFARKSAHIHPSGAHSDQNGRPLSSQEAQHGGPQAERYR